MRAQIGLLCEWLSFHYLIECLTHSRHLTIFEQMSEWVDEFSTLLHFLSFSNWYEVCQFRLLNISHTQCLCTYHHLHLESWHGIWLAHFLSVSHSPRTVFLDPQGALTEMKVNCIALLFNMHFPLWHITLRFWVRWQTFII